MSVHDPRITPLRRPRTDGTPFDDTAFGGPVAIALSGGGFRAAGYHLGVLCILHRAGLLQRAEVLTATSAGAIVGLRLLHGLARGESFIDIDFALRRYLLAGTPLHTATDAASRTGVSVVKAFADALDRDLFSAGGRPVARLQTVLEARTSFREGSFNAAILHGASPFRFEFSRAEHARFGSEGASLPRRIAEDIRCADVVAASCAFPGAFEPMVMPDDFTWSDESTAEAAREALGRKRFALVDGGIHDETTLDAMLGAAARLQTGAGLFVVSDAARTPGAAHAPEEPSPGWLAPRLLTVARLDALALLVVLGSLVTAGLVAEKARQEVGIGDFRLPADGIAYGAPIAFCLFVALLTLFARRLAVRALRPLLAEFGPKERRALRRTPVARIAGALAAKTQALAAVATTTFPARLSALVWRGARSDDRFAERRVASELAPLDATSFELVENLYAPSAELIEATRRAAALPPAFALADAGQLDDLLLTGQAITVARIVELLELKHGPAAELWPRAERGLLTRLAADWERLNTTARPLRPDDGTFRA